jgi:DNA-binding GntR family transcriptional regulator
MVLGMNDGPSKLSVHLGVDPLDAPPLRFKVAERIERMIADGNLKPGDRLRESELASLLRVSRGPIREALQLLENDGWVEVRPRLGARVRERTVREVWEYFEVRSVLETHAAKLAATTLSEAGRQHLADLMDSCGKALESSNLDELREANRTVHRYITELGGNEALTDLVRHLGRRVYAFTQRTPHRTTEVYWEHRKIVDAILARDVETVGTLMVDHSRNNWLAYQQHIAKPDSSTGIEQQAGQVHR